MNDTSPNLLAEKLLLAVKMSQDTSELQSTLAAFPLASLKSGLDSDEKKKAFWINVYNAIPLFLPLIAPARLRPALSRGAAPNELRAYLPVFIEF
jgi:hypothetical protein